jgi:hypothetical protein
MGTWQEPDWSKRLPGEQWLILDSPQSAESYLSGLPPQTLIVRQPYPNPEGLYAQFSPPGQVFQNRLYVPLP